MRTLEYYKSLDYKIIIEKQSFESETYFVCFSEELGKYSCFGQGDNVEEAIKNYYTEKDIFIESLYNEGLEIPEPEKSQEDLLSGVFNVRTDPATHTNISKIARKNNLSLNQYINKLIHESSVLSNYEQTIGSKFDELKELIIGHDCNVKQQFNDLWLNMSLKKMASSMRHNKKQELEDDYKFDELAA